MSLQRAAGMNINWGLLREEERKKKSWGEGAVAASLGLGRVFFFFCKCLFYVFVGFCNDLLLVFFSFRVSL